MTECPASFDTLPLELLLAIFESTDNKDLLSVGKLCRRLNSIAIPIFLWRVNMKAPEESVFIRPLHNSHADQLSGLTVDFSFVSMKQFVCVLNHRQDNSRKPEDYSKVSPIEGLRKNIQRVHQLISRVQSVDSVCIVFHPMGGFWSLRLPVVEEFLTFFFELVETIALKSCSSLQILHPHLIALKPPYKFHLSSSNAIVKSLALIKPRNSELEGDGWKFRPIFKYKTPPTLSPALTSGFKLKALELYSDFLFVPPFSLWTFGFLKYSQITSLSLLMTAVMTEEEFRFYIFPRIIESLPELLELRLSAPKDNFIATAIELIPRLSKLTKVTFGAAQFGEFPPPSYLLSTARLDNLTAFTGYIDQVTYLLANVTCPILSRVNIIVDDTRGGPSYTVIGGKLAALKKRYSEMQIAPTTSMCVSHHGRATPPHPSTTLTEVDFSMISRLTLELPISLNSDDSDTFLLEFIMGWLDVFSGLTDVTLTTRQPYHDPELLAEMIAAEYANIKTLNVVDYPAVFHYHWSSAATDIRRNIDRQSDTSFFHNKTMEGCVCAEF
ncbi:hypothetical protein HYPSUDRAFT_593579 [Hypholoma sublateritium FD-334 SS-4]|uniref:F-box domain-containing protein n=1 Tax=Hypholoma sublateritium (strain FD-334 SS-4) TaxID=945553 RepID=A0A0D2P3M3_HYPSF|nr:hypothetical protein HYPSUDRAFT_593579 [Hypholoma sublateritium FD-334 SS-4]